MLKFVLRSVACAALAFAFVHNLHAQVETPCTDAEREAAVKDVEDDVSFAPSIRYEHLFFNADKIFITAGGNAGTATKTDSDQLSSDDDDTFHAALDVTLFGDHRIRLAFEPMSFEGSTTSADTFVFHGVTFPTGDRVKSTIDLDYGTAGYDYRIVKANHYDMRIGAEALIYDFDMKVRDSSAGVATSRSFTHVLPGLTFSNEWRFARNWRFGADIGGGWIGDGRYFIDLDVYVGYTIWNRVTIDVGYRYFDLGIHETTNRAELEAQGPMLSVSLRF